MNFTPEQFFVYLLVFAIAAAITYYFIQFAHQIRKRNRYMEAQIKLLSKIAEKSGVSTDDIEVIKRVADI
jgi:hypothetical protein